MQRARLAKIMNGHIPICYAKIVSMSIICIRTIISNQIPYKSIGVFAIHIHVFAFCTSETLLSFRTWKRSKILERSHAGNFGNQLVVKWKWWSTTFVTNGWHIFWEDCAVTKQLKYNFKYKQKLLSVWSEIRHCCIIVLAEELLFFVLV